MMESASLAARSGECESLLIVYAGSYRDPGSTCRPTIRRSFGAHNVRTTVVKPSGPCTASYAPRSGEQGPHYTTCSKHGPILRSEAEVWQGSATHVSHQSPSTPIPHVAGLFHTRGFLDDPNASRLAHSLCIRRSAAAWVMARMGCLSLRKPFQDAQTRGSNLELYGLIHDRVRCDGCYNSKYPNQ